MGLAFDEGLAPRRFLDGFFTESSYAEGFARIEMDYLDPATRPVRPQLRTQTRADYPCARHWPRGRARALLEPRESRPQPAARGL